MRFIFTGISIDKENLKMYYTMLKHLHNSKNTIFPVIDWLGHVECLCGVM